jgi:hypothetical protein
MPRSPLMDKPLPVSLVVPVRPVVEKYLRRKLHLGHEQPFKLTKKGTIGRTLYHILRNPQQDRQYTETVATYTGSLLVSISPQMCWLNGCRHLTAQAIHDFNRQVEDMMEEEFHHTLDVLVQHGVKFETKGKALHFMEGYGFTEDDLTLEALLKSYYRYRKAQHTAHIRINSTTDIPNCPVPLAA